MSAERDKSQGFSFVYVDLKKSYQELMERNPIEKPLKKVKRKKRKS